MKKSQYYSTFNQISNLGLPATVPPSLLLTAVPANQFKELSWQKKKPTLTHILHLV